MPTRQIAWNVGEFALAAMYALVALQALLLAYGGTRRYLMWRRGKPYGPITGVGDRLRNVLAVAFLHRRLIRPGYVYAGVMHLFIFWGFVMLFVGTVIVLLEADIARPYFGISFYQGAFYVAYKLIINLFGLLFVIGLLMAVYRRYVQRPLKFSRSLSDDAIVLGILLFLGVTGFLLQALRLAAIRDPAAPIHWVSYPLALALSGVDAGVLQATHATTWWLHMLATTVLLCYIPVSKLVHMFAGPANVFLRTRDTASQGALAPILNIEEQEHFGAARLEDFSWKQLLNADACMRCGRCLDFCPTFNTGKPLKPRQLVVEIGAYMNRQGGLLAGPAGPRIEEAGIQGHQLTEPAPRTLKDVPIAAQLLGDVVSDEEVWDCTTCRACMEQCPVLIEHVPLIVEFRRNLVLEQSRFRTSSSCCSTTSNATATRTPSRPAPAPIGPPRSRCRSSPPLRTRPAWKSCIGLAACRRSMHGRSASPRRWSRSSARRTCGSPSSAARRAAPGIRRGGPATSTCSRS